MSKGINIGTVVYYNKRLKYGFIRDDDSGTQVYFKCEGKFGWIPGYKVIYVLYTSEKGNKLEARNVFPRVN